VEVGNHKQKNNHKWLLYITIIAVLGFGTAFAYHAYQYYQWHAAGQITQENTAIVQEIFQEQLVAVKDIIEFTVRQPQICNAYEENDSKDEYIDKEEKEEKEEDPKELPTPLHPCFKANLDTAREQTGNADIIAYIHIPGTDISNVITQSTDNCFYLSRDIFGNKNANGSLFLDSLNCPHFSDKNTVIYGHNTNRVTMFHSLRYYVRNPNFFKDHPYIIITTDCNVMVYEIFATFTTCINFNYIQVKFDEPEEFEKLLSELIKRSIYRPKGIPTADDKILTLSTCTNASVDTRIVVVGKLINHLP